MSTIQLNPEGSRAIQEENQRRLIKKEINLKIIDLSVRAFSFMEKKDEKALMSLIDKLKSFVDGDSK